MNRPEGFGFVQEVRGVGAATMTSVKYASGFDNGHTHRDIPFESITSAVYRQNFAKRVKRVKVERDMYTPSSDSPKSTAHEVDTRLPVEILAPQMPHINVLDLSVFPAMSRRHTALARARGGLRVLKENEIWSAAEQVWHDLPSSKIASGYVQAFHIAKKVVEAQGDNGFLGASGSIHVGIRKDFDETATGLCRKGDKVLKAP